MIPHVAKLVGVVVHNSYVEGFLLEYCSRGDLKSLLKESHPPVAMSRKDRWAAQIAHGILMIHKAGIFHGDL